MPLKTLVIDGNCRVEDRGLKTHHGHVSFPFWFLLLNMAYIALVFGGSMIFFYHFFLSNSFYHLS